MEGRISRESLNGSAVELHYVSTRRVSEAQTRRYTPGAARSSYKNYKNSGRYKGYKTRNASPELIPEGKDLFVVQFLASGVLLLFVMFVTIVDSEGTNAVREKLSAAFSVSTSFEEFADGAAAVKDALIGGSDTVKEIFGGEIEERSEGLNDISAAKTNAAGAAAEAGEAENNGAISGSAVIDAGTLKQINENVEEYSKN